MQKSNYEQSAVTDDLEHCFLCGKSPVQFHHIFGAHNRMRATEDNLFVPLCFECHVKVHNQPSQELNYKLKQRGQWAYEETHTREEFRQRYGKSYL